MPGPRLHRSLSLPLCLSDTYHHRFAPATEPPTKRAKTTDDVDAIPYSRSAENLVPCGFASDDDDDDATTDGWVTATEEGDDDDETDLEEDTDADADANRCVECGIDLGVHNPRQYCGKTHCLYGRGNGAWAAGRVW